MASNFQILIEAVPFISDFEGAIISSSNIRPDEIILMNFRENPRINITFCDGKKIDLPLHINPQTNDVWTIYIPEKVYKEAEKDSELREFLRGLFANQRNMEVELQEKEDSIIIQPVGSRKHLFKFIFNR